MSNQLINESSPYLLQHAHNPVDWYPWGDEAFEKAKAENKLVIVSIGYSACHWCHVMEHESFEDDEVAKLMNEHYICIKVDREERPDVDHLYMDAVQIISGRGGWPLNCFTLPNGKPVYGGTYFTKDHWTEVLVQLNKLYHNDLDKVLQSAGELEKGILGISQIPDFKESSEVIDMKFIDALVSKMKEAFDTTYGGYGQAPKFPMPGTYEFLLHYAYIINHSGREQEAKYIEDFVCLTLDKMAMGGIYDVLEGGFARYSTDTIWKAPHFEKMLYDNGQLMSLYSNAYKVTGKKLYKEVVQGIYSFISRQLISPIGGFYSALDADSEGKEGQYYVWTKQELQTLIQEDLPLFIDYFSIHDEDVWEEDKYILFRKDEDDTFCEKHKIAPGYLTLKKKEWLSSLTEYRKKRVAPGLDDKILASWNGLMLKGLIDGYNALGDISFLDTAFRNANFISEKLMTTDGSLWRTFKNDKASIPAFFEDYAIVADAFFDLYQCTFDEAWLHKSEKLVEYAFTHFYDKGKNIFYYTANYHKSLITRKAETSDNVIPASNSVMANLLFNLGHALGKEDYVQTALNMLSGIKNSMSAYPYGYSNWGALALKQCCHFYEVAITGKNALKRRDVINTKYLPNKIMLGGTSQSELDLLKGKFVGGKTSIYVCENKTCQAPVKLPEEAIAIIESLK